MTWSWFSFAIGILTCCGLMVISMCAIAIRDVKKGGL